MPEHLTTHKFPVRFGSPAGHFALQLPRGARFVLFAEQHRPWGDGGLYAWFLVDPAARETELRSFRIAATGASIDPAARHLQSLLHSNQTVWHLFETTSSPIPSQMKGHSDAGENE